MKQGNILGLKGWKERKWEEVTGGGGDGGGA